MTAQVNANAIDDARVISKSQLWAGRVISGFVVLFLAWDGVMKLLKPAMVVRATRDLGYPESDIVGIGIVLMACTLLYLFPRTSVLGAILLTGYLGGAISSQIRAEQSSFNVVFASVFGCLTWAGLWLRDTRLRKCLPLQL